MLFCHHFPFVCVKIMSQKLLQAVISIDTTGSMYAAADEVRKKVRELGQRLFESCPNTEIGMIFHGDYCDTDTYVIKKLGLTSDLNTFNDFVHRIGSTYGGDAPECYELVLRESQSMGWKPDAKKVLILMGDDVPHSPTYAQNTLKLDWVKEAEKLAEQMIQIISVQCLNRSYATSFYSRLASLTNGTHVNLNQFRYVEQIILGSLIYSGNPDELSNFEKELISRNQYPIEVERAFDRISKRKASRSTTDKRKDGLIPVPPERFQVFDVDPSEKHQSRDFINAKGIDFKKGHVFYPHVTRPETIQSHKEVVLEDLNTGEMFTGSEAREMLGLGDYTTKIKQNPLPGYRCWIQSTSVNRVLRENVVMYDMNE